MSKKLNRLRRVVGKLSLRYGAEDMDVLRLRQDLNALEALGEVQAEERRKEATCRYTFGSLAKQHFRASRAADPSPH